MTVREHYRENHPFFLHLSALRTYFHTIHDAEQRLWGTLQDRNIELTLRYERDESVENDHLCLWDAAAEGEEVQAVHRLCQVAVLYSTFESFCFVMLPNERHVGVQLDWIRKPKERNEKGRWDEVMGKKVRDNEIIALLDEAQKGGMRSAIWPGREQAIRVFVELRNHLLHDGIWISEKTDSLLEKLEPLIGSLLEFPQDWVEKMRKRIRGTDGMLLLPAKFVEVLLAIIEELALALLDPVERPMLEPPSIDELLRRR